MCPNGSDGRKGREKRFRGSERLEEQMKEIPRLDSANCAGASSNPVTPALRGKRPKKTPKKVS